MSLCGWASIDERGKLSGGKPGDQTSKEVKTGNWYNFGQKYVIRYKDRNKAKKHAEALKALCKGNYVGYDQGQRGTLLTEAKKVGYNVSKIKTKCETDCSALQCTCAIIAGAKNIKLWATGSMLNGFDGKSGFKNNPDFIILTDSKYLTSGDYLLAGDIIVAPGKHTIGVIEDGPKAVKKAPTVTSVTYKITAKVLNIRAGAGTSYKVVGTYKLGEKVKVTKTSNGWGKTDKGWISLKYAVKC